MKFSLALFFAVYVSKFLFSSNENILWCAKWSDLFHSWKSKSLSKDSELILQKSHTFRNSRPNCESTRILMLKRKFLVFEIFWRNHELFWKNIHSIELIWIVPEQINQTKYCYINQNLVSSSH